MAWSSLVAYWSRIQHCYCHGSGHCCNTHSIPGPGTSICCGYSQKEKKEKKSMANKSKIKWKDEKKIIKITVPWSSCCGTAVRSESGNHTRLQVPSLASLSGSGIRCCHELWCRSLMQLRSHLTMAMASSSSPHGTPSLEISICHRYSPKKQNKNKQNHCILN